MSSAESQKEAAPQWVFALQAALHADMEADDVTSNKRNARRDLDDLRKSYLVSQDVKEDVSGGGESDTEAKPPDLDDEDQVEVQKIISDMLANDIKSPDSGIRGAAAPSSSALKEGVHSVQKLPPVPAESFSDSPASLPPSSPPPPPKDPPYIKGDKKHGSANSLRSTTTDRTNDPVKESKKPSSIYSRLVVNSKNLDTANFSPKVTISIKDSLGRLFSRESSDVTLVRKKLNRYIAALHGEIGLVQKSILFHKQHLTELTVNLKEQELQLKRWALGHLFRTFQLQAWLRASRSSLVVHVVSYIQDRLQAKADDSNLILQTVLNKLPRDKKRARPSLPPPYDIQKIDDFCVAPEVVLARDSRFQDYQTRLSLMDKLCHRSLHKFRTKLPELESKGQPERMVVLNSILSRYNTHLKNSQPLTKSRDRLTWDNFVIWSLKRQNEQNEIEKEYQGFVEDERETEGRLFRRWCILMNPKFIEDELNNLAVPIEQVVNPQQSTSASKGAFQGDTTFMTPELAQLLAANAEGAPGKSSTVSAAKATEPSSTTPQKPEMVLSPRTVIAFIRYFSREVIGKLYNIIVLSDLEEALFVLTEQLVFRRIGSVIFRYQHNGRTQKRDIAWRLKCSRCRLMNPVSSYGVAPEFLKNVENLPTQKSSGDLVLRSSRRKSSSRRRRSDSGNRSNSSPGHSAVTPTSGVAAEDSADLGMSIDNVENENSDCQNPLVTDAVPEGTTEEESECQGEKSHFVPLESREDEKKLESDDDTLKVARGPSFLRRVSGPLGEELMCLLNTPARPGLAVASPEAQPSSEIVKTLFSPEESSKSTIVLPLNDNESSTPDSPMGTPQTASSFAEQAPQSKSRLVKMNSMDSTVGVKDRSGSVSMAQSMRCPGCDACRGRVCRPRLACDLLTILTPVRYVATAYPSDDPGVVSVGPPKKMPRSASSGLEQGELPQVTNQAVFWHEKLKYALPFKHTIRLLTSLSSAVCPRDMVFILTWTMKWLHTEAIDAKGDLCFFAMETSPSDATAFLIVTILGKADFLGADLMIPLLVMCLIHAKIPSIHLIMQFIRNYGSIDPCGESAYIMTCFEAAVAFIDRLEVPPELEADADLAYHQFDQQLISAGLRRNSSRNHLRQESIEGSLSSNHCLVLSASNGNLSGMVDPDGVLRVSAGFAQQPDVKEIEEMAMEKLGEWLRDQKAMEDTIGILQQEGWMA